MEALLSSLLAGLREPEVWKHVSIPFVAGVVGWATNWVAIRMTFQPLEFVGVRPWLGWQGIIPSKAAKMARIFVDQTMHRLGTLEEVFQQMDPHLIARHVVRVMDRRVEEITDEIMFVHHSTAWRMLPAPMKRRVYDRVREELPDLVDRLMEEVAGNVEELLDFKHMIVSRLERDKALLNRLFLEAGEVEFRFIVRSGFYFGFGFGLVQLGVWLLYQGWWVLPIFGLIVGYATNWLALNIIFRPLYPHRVGPWTIQGLFLRRQQEVSAAWCRVVSGEILTLQNLVHAMLYGPRSQRVRALIARHIGPIADEAVGPLKPVAELALGDGSLGRLRTSVAEKAIEVSTEPFDHWPFDRDRSARIEALLRERMEAMPPDQFQDLLRPCFQEDETILILVGAALGFLAGTAQLVFVFGGV